MVSDTVSERALVTGATSGIGRAFAVALAERGHRLVLVARDERRLQHTMEALPGGPHEMLAADLATHRGYEDVAHRIESDDDAIGLLVNAAGMGTSGAFPDVDLAAEEAQLELNVTACLRLSWTAARAMRGRGHGAIINIASTAAIWSVGTYAASKAWVIAATQGLADSMAGGPVRVLCVIPGFTRTEFHLRSGVDNSGVRSWLWLAPETVASEALQALCEGRVTCVPGRQYRILLPIVSLLPPGARRALLRRLAPLRPAA
ncbi:MAG: SDR family NAD(P)-dependent oxidoreductase [Solirubrobacteraceae bacterium]